MIAFLKTHANLIIVNFIRAHVNNGIDCLSRDANSILTFRVKEVCSGQIWHEARDTLVWSIMIGEFCEAHYFCIGILWYK